MQPCPLSLGTWRNYEYLYSKGLPVRGIGKGRTPLAPLQALVCHFVILFFWLSGLVLSLVQLGIGFVVGDIIIIICFALVLQ